MITVYTDGSSRGNPGPGGYAAVIFYQKSLNNESGIKNKEWVTEIGGRRDLTTNNKMELLAAIKALKYLDSSFIIHDSLTIHTDSEYLMKGITLWIHNWQKKNWRTAGRKPVLNKDLWQELLPLTEGVKIEWKYVAGHSGVPANERCDEIATKLADNITPDLYDGQRNKYPISI